jgi:hypothetical protein
VPSKSIGPKWLNSGTFTVPVSFQRVVEAESRCSLNVSSWCAPVVKVVSWPTLKLLPVNVPF